MSLQDEIQLELRVPLVEPLCEKFDDVKGALLSARDRANRRGWKHHVAAIDDAIAKLEECRTGAAYIRTRAETRAKLLSRARTPLVPA